jgi:uncharacterized repeat protein (TIGR03843 family)
MPNLHLSLRDDAGEPRSFSTTSLPEDEALEMLATADITGSELVPWGSNYTFAVLLRAADDTEHLAIYKPRAGEAPLYDFPDGTLYLRETASYRLSRMLAWDIVPPTVVREGPHGEGSVQLYVAPADEEEHPSRFWGRRSPEIERLVLFDYIANNADRKIGHCLRDASGKIWGIDHGLTFNEYPKLRTVLWQYAGRPISKKLMHDLERIECEWESFDEALRPFISAVERESFRKRVNRMMRIGCFPELDPRRNIPYGW